MPRTNDTVFDAPRKGHLFLAVVLILQTTLLAFVLLRLDDGAPQRPVRNAVEPCTHPFNARPERLPPDDRCLAHPTRVSGRA
ncbi:MAG: hypothetical protein ACR2PF_12235 [Rhizobiaceae bacterium]